MKNIIYHQFQNDESVIKAKEILIAQYQKYQQQLRSVKKPEKSLKVSYDAFLDRFSKMRGGNLWYPYLGTGMGNGSLVELGDGSVKYDMISGIGAHWGHGNKEILEGQIEGACQDLVNQGNLQQNMNSLETVELFVELSGLPHCFLTTSGAMAAENGLKLCLQKNAPAYRIFAFEKCFMGRTMALSFITDKQAYRQGLPQTVSVDYLPFYDENDPEGSTQRCLEEIQRYCHRYPGQHAVFCAELIQGEGGYYPGNTTFFKTIMTALKQHNVAILVDEIQTFGRTPSIFAFKEFKLEDLVDVVTVGKLSQVCATLYKSEFKPKPGLISQTFTSSSTAIEVSKRILLALRDDGYKGKRGKIHVLSTYFRDRLNELAKKFPKIVQGPFGYGAMLAATFFNGDPEKVMLFTKELFDEGVICFIAGEQPKRVRFLPPIGSLCKEDIDGVFEIIEKVLKKRL